MDPRLIPTLDRCPFDLVIVVCLSAHGKYRVVYSFKQWKIFNVLQ